MASPERSIRVYQELATHYDSRGEPQVRDRFLVLAADAASTAGRPDDAERLRQRLLQLNPHHMLKPYSSWSQALQSQDVRSYIEGLRRTYPPSSAENLLESVRGSNDMDTTPQALPSAALDATVPYSSPTMETPTPTVRMVKPTVAVPVATEAPAAIPFAPDVRTIPAPVAKTAPPPVSGRNIAKKAVGQSWLSDGILNDPTAAQPSGNWVAVLLFYVVLVGSLALGAYTFVRPWYSLAGRNAEPTSRELKSQP